ncbi:ARM repeat-containing protein [Heliocybe sulcata]|uniref:ARM repeat-containing protein n=1 Tax=Heliocybe sulcata TaxID=5364 RepID=A0A5C3N9G1_9AGAM|nr:ARM repeat-containing protein [Heliocybe sulcata]
MDYLRTLGSAAVSSLVQKSGLNLPFTLGGKVEDGSNEIWTLYDGTKRDDGSPVSVFEFDANAPSRRNFMPLAKNALRKLRTTRHPDVLKFMDAVETDTTIHIMTERVRPLRSALQAWSSKSPKEREEWLLWGLHRISVALAFVNGPCASTHGNMRVQSIFISPSGEWKLGGFEALSNKDDMSGYYIASSLPDSMKYASPEVKKSGWFVLKEHDPGALDGYSLGILLNSVFNPSFPVPPTTEPPHPPPTASSRGAIPAGLFPSFKRLLNPNPKGRLTPKGFLEIGMAETAGEGSGFFANNNLVKICAGLDNFNIASDAEKGTFLRTLKESASSFPPEFASHRVLPSLISALEFGGASAASILPLVLQMGKNVAPADYSTQVLAPLTKLFASSDRGTRMALIDHMEEYSDKLDKKTVTDKIWPHLQTGFTDTVAVIREATVRSIILLAPNFSDRILNNDLLRHLAKMQSDPEASIRTNTCILLGRLGPTLGYNTKRKVLVPAFSRALKDPFVHARVAGLMAFMATIDCFEPDELASKVVPSISPSLVDKEKLVRDQAFKAIELFMKRLETHAATMAETVIAENGELPGVPGTPNGAGPWAPPAAAQGNLVNSAAGAAGALAGWAISSLGKKLVSSDLQTAISSSPSLGIDRPISAPPPVTLNAPSSSSNIARPSPLAAASTPDVLRPSSLALGGASKAKGLQLGAHKVPASASAAVFPTELEDEVNAATSIDANNPWGNDDLMDVHADEDDWSAFETAPPIVEPKPVSIVATQSLRSSMVSAHNQDSSWDDFGMAAVPALSSASQNRKAPTSSRMKSPPRATPSPLSRVSSPAPAASPTPVSSAASTAGMSKEEKAAELARRKEERKQRIAQLKEQKKNAGTK